MINEIKVNYLFETGKSSIKTYYQMKNKQNLSFEKDEKEMFIQNIIKQIKDNYELDNYDYILMPETKNECFKEIIEQLNKRTVVFTKNSKEEVLNQLSLQKMMKDERKKLVSAIECMDDIKIGLIAANQRLRVANLLFKVQEDLTDKKVLFMDDSVFTGSTLKAISQFIKIEEALVLFTNE